MISIWIIAQIYLVSSMIGHRFMSQSRFVGLVGSSTTGRTFKTFLASMSSHRHPFSSECAFSRKENVGNSLSDYSKQRIDKLVAALHPSGSILEETSQLYETSFLANNSLLRHIHDLFGRNQKVNEEYLSTLLDMSIEMLSSYPNVIPFQLHHNSSSGEKEGTLNICGDTHGQYDDFTEIFSDKVGGYPSFSNRFVFNGDIADRGPKAVEIFATLLTMKMINPDAVHILRGNHEDEQMTKRFGFEKEVCTKYNRSMADKFYKLFNSLPIAAVAENEIFIVHGGLGPSSCNLTIDQINKLQRSADDSTIDEFLWADPRDNVDTFANNHARGGGVLFGPKVTDYFLSKNNLKLLVRSHEMQDYGYCVMHNNRCITVFSAPNYCGVCNNQGAILTVSKLPENATAKSHPFNVHLAVKLFEAKLPPKARK
jgi:diadenosine tetraphosphatase ApaH/serine/threonine PP2A family protein phosphatase